MSTQLKGLIAMLLALVPHGATAQAPPPPVSPQPFAVQLPSMAAPTATSTNPMSATPATSASPQGASGSAAAPGNSFVPIALPPSSGGMGTTTNPSVPVGLPNTYNQPSAIPRELPPTRSEIIPYSAEPELKSVLVVKTSEGEFKITLRAEIAPRNVENFVDLALGQKEFIDVRTGKKVKRPFYTGLNCHRVLKGVLIQCGCPFGNGTGGPGFNVRDERSTAMRFDRPGVVAMALSRKSGDKGLTYEANSAGSQFFISLAPLPDYNDQFTVIGQVTSGMETLRKIASTATGPTDRPLKRVIIFSVDPDIPTVPSQPLVDPMLQLAPTGPTTVPLSPGTPTDFIDPFAIPPPPTNP